MIRNSVFSTFVVGAAGEAAVVLLPLGLMGAVPFVVAIAFEVVKLVVLVVCVLANEFRRIAGIGLFVFGHLGTEFVAVGTTTVAAVGLVVTFAE